MFARKNPHLHMDGRFPPPPDEAAHGTPCNAARTGLAGGMLAQLIQHPSFVTLEHLFRRFPSDGMFEASPQKPFVGDLGSLHVPDNMIYCLCDYRFDLYRLNGAAAGDFVPIESRRLSTQVTFDVTVDNYRKSNLEYHIDPEPFTATKEAYYPAPTGSLFPNVKPSGVPTITPDPFGQQQSFLDQVTQANLGSGGFDVGQFTRTASPAGPALSALPQRHERQGAPNMPFTMLVQPNQTLTFSTQVFRKIPIPIAFFEVAFSGFLIPGNFLRDILTSLQPCVSPGGGR